MDLPVGTRITASNITACYYGTVTSDKITILIFPISICFYAPAHYFGLHHAQNIFIRVDCGLGSRQHGGLDIRRMKYRYCIADFIKFPLLDCGVPQHNRTGTRPSMCGINQGDMGMDNFSQEHTTDQNWQ